MAYKTLNLDLAKSPILKSIVYGRIGDSDMQTVTVNVTSRDVPVDLTGFIITFEGITNGEKTKVFDVDGISSTDEGLKKGTFDYTFPNMAFAVGGSYEIAYFSIVKGDKRDTTGEFDIIVGSNADIDAAEAETIITEYNKLVKELHAITDKYISDSDAKFADINAKIVDLQAKITQYQTTVKNTADSAVSTINTTKDSAINAVNTSSNAAIKAVDDALKKFESGDFYTKSETDSKFKVVNDLIISQDIPEGANLDDYKKEGEFSKKTPTVVTGAPEGVTGAFRLSVRSMVGSSGIFQTLYDYATRAIYYRIGNTSLGFNLPWQRIANDSEVVHLTGDETIEGKKTFTGSLKVSDNVVYGVTKNEGWYEERLDDNYYRWTKREDYTNIAVENTHGSGYISPNVPGPTYPSNAVIDKRFPTSADGSVVVATLDGSGMRLMSVASKAARNYSVFWTAYGSKK